MACSSCGRPRTQMTRNTGAAKSPTQMSTSSNIRTVDSQSVGVKVQSAVVSNPNTAARTKV